MADMQYGFGVVLTQNYSGQPVEIRYTRNSYIRYTEVYNQDVDLLDSWPDNVVYTESLSTNYTLLVYLRNSMNYQDEVIKICRTPSIVVTLNLDYCSRVFGVSPCLATGVPCYNTWPTCRYTSAYLNIGKAYKFCSRDIPIPLPGENVRPYLAEMDHLGQEILQQEALTLNQQLTITMSDEEDNDIGIDPYRVSSTLRDAGGGNSQSISPANTFWRKLISRNPNYKNRIITVKQGFVKDGFTEAEYQLYFKGILDNISFDNRHRAKLIIKGLLQLTDVDYPKKTDGQLSSDIDSSATSFTLKAWTGLDTSSSPVISQHDSSGYIRINSEIFSYSSISLDTATGITTFSGLQRGQFNGDGWSQATSHKAGDMVQQVKTYVDQNPIDIMKSLLNQAGIADADIDVVQFNAERDKWFVGVKFRGILHEPIKVKTYLQELREQTFTSIWQGDDQRITVKFTGPNLPGQTYRQITDSANIIHSSHAVDDRKHEYLSRATLYYEIVANSQGTESAHFKRATVVINSNAEGANEFGAVTSRKPIYSRWIRTDLSGDAYTRSVGNRILRQAYQGIQTIQFELELKDEDLALGEIFELTSKDVVDIDGQSKVERWQVVKKQKLSGGKFQYVAVNTRLKRRYAFVAPNGTPNYTSASSAQREYGFISDNSGKMSNGDDGYLVI